ncbi:phage head-tail connector protein [Bacillus sp. FSL W7-1360]
MIKSVKSLLGIKDDLQDEVISIIIDNVTSHLRLMLEKDVPKELSFIVVEISVRRFQRLGSEGMKSESTEGHQVTFYDLKDEFVPYMDIIARYKNDEQRSPRRGKVMFL